MVAAAAVVVAIVVVRAGKSRDGEGVTRVAPGCDAHRHGEQPDDVQARLSRHARDLANGELGVRREEDPVLLQRVAGYFDERLDGLDEADAVREERGVKARIKAARHQLAQDRDARNHRGDLVVLRLFAFPAHLEVVLRQQGQRARDNTLLVRLDHEDGDDVVQRGLWHADDL